MCAVGQFVARGRCSTLNQNSHVCSLLKPCIKMSQWKWSLFKFVRFSKSVRYACVILFGIVTYQYRGIVVTKQSNRFWFFMFCLKINVVESDKSAISYWKLFKMRRWSLKSVRFGEDCKEKGNLRENVFSYPSSASWGLLCLRILLLKNYW